MAIVQDIRKTMIDSTPVFAAVGVTDLAAEKVREARLVAANIGKELAPGALQTKATKRATQAVEQAQQAPTRAITRSVEIAEKAQQGYTDLAKRGEQLVRRVRHQKATKDLVAQAETTVALSKGAVTTVRNAASDIERSAKATLTTGRKEAVVAADALADSMAEEAKTASSTVRGSATRTRTAAKRTATTTRDRGKKSAASTKRATTTARKTAKTSAKVTRTAAAKVGD